MARARWTSPSARADHSWAAMIRGTRSSRKGRWLPATPKVSPFDAANSSMRLALRSISSALMASMASKTRRYAAVGVPATVTASSRRLAG